MAVPGKHPLGVLLAIIGPDWILSRQASVLAKRMVQGLTTSLVEPIANIHLIVCGGEILPMVHWFIGGAIVLLAYWRVRQNFSVDENFTANSQ